MSIEQFVDECSIPCSHFFRYLQVHALVEKHFSSFPLLPANSWADEHLDIVILYYTRVALAVRSWTAHGNCQIIIIIIIIIHQLISLSDMACFNLKFLMDSIALEASFPGYILTWIQPAPDATRP